MLWVVPIWRTPWLVLLAFAGTVGCMEMGTAVGRGAAELIKSPAKLPPCSVAAEDSTQFVDSPIISRWAYDGSIRPRPEVAVLFVRSILGHATGVTMVYADALDGRVEISQVQPDSHARLTFESSDCVVQDCFRLAILAGTHIYRPGPNDGVITVEPNKEMKLTSVERTECPGPVSSA